MVTNRRYKSLEGLTVPLPGTEPLTAEGKTYREHFWDSVKKESQPLIDKRKERQANNQLPVNDLKPYPSWVCCDCGRKASHGRQFDVSTYHQGECGVCHQDKSVTEPRDFYYPSFNGHKNT